MNFPFESGKVKAYILSKNEAEVEYSGHIELTQDGAFKTYDTWPCQNDCFRTWIGSYEILSEDKIQFKAKKLSRSGYCGDKLREENFDIPKDLGTFKIVVSIEGIILTRI